METGFEKIKAFKDKMLEDPIRLDAEYTRFCMDVYRKYEGQPAIIKRARVFEKLCDEKTIYIDENPIVGTMGNGPTALYFTPEFANHFLTLQLKGQFEQLLNSPEENESLRVGLGPVAALSDDDMKLILEAIDYWKDKGVGIRSRQLYEELYPDDPKTIQIEFQAGTNHSIVTEFNLGFTLADYEKALNIGLTGILKEIEDAEARLPIGILEDFNKRYFYKATRITLEAMIRLANRYAALAKDMASKEKNPERRRELIEIAEVCQNVPANPPRNFREACQSFWFIHMGILIEGPNAGAVAPGRFPQYMYPFYKKDKDQGGITQDQAMSFMGWTFLKIQGYGVFQPGWNFKAQQGQTAQHISLGGVNSRGEDATNDLDYMALEVQKHLKLTQPSLTVMWHDKLPEDFLLKCVELIRTGIGQPQILNNERAIERSIFHFPGLTLEEARSVANIACVPARPSKCCSNLWGGVVNMPKALEVALNNGIDPISGLRMAPEVGNAENFETFEQVQEAVEKVIRFRVDRHLNCNNLNFGIFAEVLPLPFVSCFINDCIPRGVDIQNGGAKYSTNFIMPVGTVDLGNSLAAIKNLVFDKKKITIEELKAALKANFEGNEYENIQKMCMESPKYGNGDDYADSIVQHFFTIYNDEHKKTCDPFGFVNHPEAYSVSTHNLHGGFCGATPDGRKAKVPFTDATVSATPGTDRKGPTALARSAARVVDTMEYGATHLNMKFHPSSLEGVQGARNLLSLVKTYMDLGGHHVQFNCISVDTLKDAQQNPGQYRDLVVRVAGFSAYWVNLDRTVQDEIIRRTELKFD